MNISSIISKSKHLVSDNSPVLLTAVGVAGVITTAYLTHKAAVKMTGEELEYEFMTKDDDARYEPTAKELIQKHWKLYIPPVSVAAVTCVSIIGANRIGTRRAAAVAAAYTISERAYDEYKSKVIERIGVNKEREIRDSIAQDRVTRDITHAGELIEQDGKVLCHDAYSGRFFYSTVESVNKAVNVVNKEINDNGSATISDFYDAVGLSHTSISDSFGWNTRELLELNWTTCATPDGRPAMSYDFRADPFLRPWSKAAF